MRYLVNWFGSTFVADFSAVALIVGDVGNDLHAAIGQHDFVASLHCTVDLGLGVGEIVAGGFVFDGVGEGVVFFVVV